MSSFASRNLPPDMDDDEDDVGFSDHHFSRSVSMDKITDTVAGIHLKSTDDLFTSENCIARKSIAARITPAIHSRVVSRTFAVELGVSILSGPFAILLWVCLQGYEPLIKDLLQIPEFRSVISRRRPDIDRLHLQQFALLVAAAHGGKSGVVKQLILSQCDVDQRDRHGRTALWYAASEGHLSVVKLLTGIRANAAPSMDGISPLHRAVIRDHVAVGEHLLSTALQGCVDMLDTRGRTPLWWACRVGALQCVQLLMSYGADATRTDSKGISPFCKACAKGRINVVKELFESRRISMTRDQQQRSPLFHACKNGHVEVVKYLLDNGVSFSEEDSSGATPLKVAVERLRSDVVIELLNHGCDVNTPDARNRTPLYEACKLGDLKLVSLLLGHEADPNIAAVTGMTPLLLATKLKDVKLVEILLEAGADPNRADTEGVNPLISAALDGLADITDVLLDSGADVTFRTRSDKTALIVAAARGHDYVVRSLLKAGADVDATRDNGCTALYCACSHGHTEVAKILLELGADPDIPTEQGATALFTACHKGHDAVVQLLLSIQLDRSRTMDGDITPLHVASHHGHSSIVQMLLDAGFEKDRRKSNGSTPLLTASAVGKASVVEVLLKHGANPDIADFEGWTPLTVACCGRFEEVATLVLSFGCDVHAGPKDITPLHLASRKGLNRIVAMLIQRDCFVDYATDSGWTSLLLASNNGFLNIVNQLIAAGANVNVVTPDQQLSPILVASRKGHTAIVHTLVKHGAEVGGVLDELLLRFPTEAANAVECRSLLELYDTLRTASHPGLPSLRFVRALPLRLLLQGLPAVCKHEKEMKNIAYTLCMALHPRLGAASNLKFLSRDLMGVVLDDLLYETEDEKATATEGQGQPDQLAPTYPTTPTNP